MNILRNIAKGFDIAYPEDAYRGDDSTINIRGAAPTDAEVQAWSHPKHPTKSDVKLVDSYPVVPDLDALPTMGAYMVAKFSANPLGASETYDQRLDAGILRPINDPVRAAEYERKMADWDPASSKPQPTQEYDYDFYVPPEQAYVRGIKRKFDVNDPDNEDPALYTDELESGTRAFKLGRLRTYEVQSQVGNPDNFYNDTLGLALHDPESDVGAVPGTQKRLSKAAYFYPIIQRTALRPKRKVGRAANSQMDEERVDELNITVSDIPEDWMAMLQEKKAELDPSLKVEAAPTTEAVADGTAGAAS